MRRFARSVLFVSLAAAFVAAWLGQHELQYGPERARGGWILLGSVGGLIGLIVLARFSTVPNPLAPNPLSQRLEWLAVTGLFLIGVVFRLVHFSTIPEGINHDSAWYGLYAIHITQGAEYTPYISAAWGRETLFMYVVAPFLWVFGNSPEALQAASTLVGIAALLPMYALARAMFGVPTALAALAFLAVSGWHLVFSRVGWRVITVVPFELMALYGAWRATQRGIWRDWVIFGAGAAASIYTYNAARIVPAICLVYYVIFFFPRRRAWRRYLAGGLVALLTFLIVGGPMLWYAATHFEQFQGRADYLAQERDAKGGMVFNWESAAAMFNYAGNGNDFFVREPLLEPLAAVLFLSGLAVALWRIRSPQSIFLLVGFVVSLVPGVLAVPNGNRCITAIPFAYSFIAMGTVAITDTAGALLARRAASWILMIVMVGVAATETYNQFLGPARRPLYGISPGATAAGLYMRRYRDQYKIFTISSWPQDTINYLSNNGAGSPFERHWVWVQSFADAEKEVDPHGTKGLLFLTDLGVIGESAFVHLEKRFPEHRTEWLQPPRVGDSPVGRAFFVDRPALGQSGLWSNFSRSVFLHRAADASSAGAARCFEPVHGVQGLSLRVRLMLPELREPHVVGGVQLLGSCKDDAPPLLRLEVDADGLVVNGVEKGTLLPWARLEAGRWYDVYVTLGSDQRAEVTVEGITPAATGSVRLDPNRPIQLGGIMLNAPSAGEPGGELYVDDLTLLGGRVAAGDPRWVRDKRPQALAIVDEDFEARPFGPLAGADGWQGIVGAVTVAASPTVAHTTAGEVTAGVNAFDAEEGSDPGDFKEPMGVAVDPRGNFYVTERVNNRIQKFAADGTFVTAWGTEGSEPGEFREPMDAAADDQFLYVADTWNHRVQVFDWNGTLLFMIRGEPTLSSPRGIYARDGRVYLADSGRSRIRVFDRSGKQLMMLGEGGQGGGDGPGQLQEPVDLVADRAGRIYVVNCGKNRIEIFGADGTPVGSFPVPGWEGPNLKEAYLAIDQNDVLYMSDPGTGTVRRFTKEGTELASVAAPNLNTPSGLAIQGKQLIVTARRANQVRAAALPGQS